LNKVAIIIAILETVRSRNQGDAALNKQKNIESLLHENRRFRPSAEFIANSIADSDIYERARADRLKFWAEQSANLLHWHQPFSEILDWSNPPYARWFADGKLNVAYNCVDRHVLQGNGNRIALNFEGEPGDSRTITYSELSVEVNKAANLLTKMGLKQGDRVIIYMPLIPEAVVAMLAVARLGAIHSVVFGGFSAESLRARISDAKATLVITADGGYRKGKPFPLKSAVDEALRSGKNSVSNVLVVKRTNSEVDWVEGRDLWWEKEIAPMSVAHEAQPFESENTLFILYTSGTTGKPKGIQHSSGGYLTQAAFTHKNVFDLHSESDVYWCTADIGWITGHSYVVYGPLANGSTQVIYEGTPDSPHPGRWWEIIEKYGVTIFYTAPTAIRTFMKIGREVPQKFDLSSLRLLGTVGEPINPEAWVWYRDVIGSGVTPIVDTWWQTETGAIMISALPGLTETKPGSAQVPIPGISVDVLADDGQRVESGAGGLLVVTEPWPSMLRGVWGDDKRYKDTYWSKFDGHYFAGDGAHLDGDGDVWLLGRVDDVMNVSGHRLSTMEVESSLVAHQMTAEAAVVGAGDDVTGEAIVAFVILKSRFADSLSPTEVSDELRAWVAKEIGPIAKPRDVYVVKELPKTRSGKIMRRLLRDIAEGREVGDTTTLTDETVISAISRGLG